MAWSAGYDQLQSYSELALFPAAIFVLLCSHSRMPDQKKPDVKTPGKTKPN
jgi:hypothetical protein